MINQAIILAAGLGTRLRPLTNDCPKPMLEIDGKPLLVHQLEALAKAQIERVVIHTSYLSDYIKTKLNNGKAYHLNLDIQYAHTDEPLDTGGGLTYSIEQLLDQNSPFICVNGKIFTDYNYLNLNKFYSDKNFDNKLAHWVLVPNPEENPRGDYDLDQNTQTLIKKFHSADQIYPFTYSGIAIYNTALILPKLLYYYRLNKKFSLINIINNNLSLIGGSVYTGQWDGLETVEQYNSLFTKYTKYLQCPNTYPNTQ